MIGWVRRLLWWGFLGAVAFALAGATWRLHGLMRDGHSPLDYPVDVLLLRYLRVHEWAAIGAVAAASLGASERAMAALARGVGFLLARLRRGAGLADRSDPGALIRADQRRRAERYLADRGAGPGRSRGEVARPPYEHVITARGGTLTYRVLAWRRLDESESRAAISTALGNGTLAEPAPGETAVLVTDIR